jgi:hypothetical protein
VHKALQRQHGPHWGLSAHLLLVCDVAHKSPNWHGAFENESVVDAISFRRGP